MKTTGTHENRDAARTPRRGAGRLRRNLLRFTILVLSGFAVLLATLPWWIGPALARLGPAWGASFSSYERIGYTRFALHDVIVRQPGVEVTASRVETDTPVIWLWRRWTGQSSTVAAERWNVGVTASNRPATAGPPEGWTNLRAQLLRIVPVLDHWLPQATTGAGAVQWPGGEIKVAAMTWSARTLTLEKLAYGATALDAVLTFPAATDELQLTAHKADASSTVQLQSIGAALSGEIVWHGQVAQLRARFDEHGWVPAEASIHAADWAVPGVRLNLGDLYSIVRGTGKLEWRTDSATAELSVQGEPVEGKSAPPLEATLRGHGDTHAFTVDTLHATLPGITAQLSEPVTVDRKGAIQHGAAQFVVQADLAKIPWLIAHGRVTGEARLETRITRSPMVTFQLATQDLAAGPLALQSAKVHGRFEWPLLEIAAATVTTPEGETLSAHGGWNFRTREIMETEVSGTIGSAVVARWFPQRPDFDVLRVELRASGPLTNLRHRGIARTDAVKLASLNPLALAVTWQGVGRILEEFTAEATAGKTTVSAAGTTTRDALTLNQLTLTQNHTPRLKLTAPATITWVPNLQIDTLQLEGDGKISAAITWGETGQIDVAMEHILSAWCAELLPLGDTRWQVNSLVVSGKWNHGPMTFSAIGAAAVELDDRHTAVIELSAKGNKDGLTLETFHASDGTTPVFTASAQIPVTFVPGDAALIRIEPSGPLAVDVSTSANTTFWTELQTLTGIELKDPQVTANITGTWAQPSGTIRVQAARIARVPGRSKLTWPALDAVDIAVTGNRDGFNLDAFSLKVEGQAVRAQGRLEVGAKKWKDLFDDPLAFAQRHGRLHLEIPDADLTAAANSLPPFLAPRGRLTVDLNLKDGGALEGSIQLHDAASRPLGPFGILQEINADVRLNGRHVELRSITAKAGGQPITLSGTIDHTASDRLRFDVALRGTNLPFVRKSGLLVRGDLDLQLRTPSSGPTSLTGTVRLHDSLLLADVRAFLPGGTKGGSQQPPYFSVETPPFSTWGIDLDVSGERFMRLRTPVFNGVASSQFRISGTFGEPRLLGEIAIDEGRVLMPFAQFAVKQGTARITEANPHELALFVRAIGRRLNYEVTMEITGTADAPSVVFTSSPALDSKQLLLMVMTGAAPQNEVAYSDNQRYARLGAYLGRSLLGTFSSETDTSDRLTLTGGEQVSRQGRETYDIEYRMTERWKLVGEYDEFDDYNVGLKWRLYPGKRKPETSPDEPK